MNPFQPVSRLRQACRIGGPDGPLASCRLRSHPKERDISCGLCCQPIKTLRREGKLRSVGHKAAPAQGFQARKPFKEFYQRWGLERAGSGLFKKFYEQASPAEGHHEK